MSVGAAQSGAVEKAFVQDPRLVSNYMWVEALHIYGDLAGCGVDETCEERAS